MLQTGRVCLQRTSLHRSLRSAAVALVVVQATATAVFATGPSAPDPAQAVRRGLPAVPAALQPVLPAGTGDLPMEPLERDATEGLRHGWVQTTSGRFGFKTVDLTLAARVPLKLGRVYDAGLEAALPGVPFGEEPRMFRDLGVNWLLRPTSALIPWNTGFLMLTGEAGVVEYVPAGDGTYLPAPDRPSPFGPLVPNGQGGLTSRMRSGTLRTYAMVPGASNYWLVREEDPSGNALDFEYVDGYLHRITATDGAWAEFHRPMWGESAPPSLKPTRIVRISDSMGRELTCGYDADHRLTSFTNADGETWTYGWDFEDHIVDVLPPGLPAVFHVTTDAEHRAASVRVGDLETGFSYAADQTVVTEPNGGTWTYSYDARGMTSTITDPVQATWAITRGTASGDVVTITDPLGAVHAFTHDTSHRLTSYSGPAIAGNSPVWTFAYDGDGRLTRTVHPAGAASELHYDASGWLVEEASDPDADGTAEAVTVYERDAVTGDIIARIDPELRRVEYDRDAHGLVEAVRPQGETITPEYRYEHDAAGRIVAFEVPSGSGTWDRWELAWSPGGRLTSMTDPLANSWAVSTDALGHLVSTTDPTGATTEYQHSVDGRLTRVEDPLGHARIWTYDGGGQLVWYEDETGAQWEYDHDAGGRVISVTDPEGRCWSYGLDALGHVIEHTLPGGQEIDVTRDAASRMIRRDLPDGTIERFEWDAEGRLTYMERDPADGGVIDSWTYTWDGQGLPLSVETSLATGDGNQVTRTGTWTWDSSGRLVGWQDADGRIWSVTEDGLGRPTAFTHGATTSTVTRDPWSGRVLGRFHAELQLEESYMFDAAGRVTEFQEWESGELTKDLTYTRDAAGRIQTITDHLVGPDEVTTLIRDEAGRITEVQQPGGSVDRLRYDAASRTVAWIGQDPDGAIRRREYAYDRSGRILEYVADGRHIGFDWDFSPADPRLAFEVRRWGTGPLGDTILLNYDVDGRISEVVDHATGSAVARRDYRWLPGGISLPAAETSRDASGALERDVHFFDMLGRGWSRHSASGEVADWTLPAALTSSHARAGAWRERLWGRRHSLPDDGEVLRRSFAHDAGLMSRLGGSTLESGISLPAPFWNSPEPDLQTAADRSETAAIPDSHLVDDVLGLPVRPAPWLEAAEPSYYQALRSARVCAFKNSASADGECQDAVTVIQRRGSAPPYPLIVNDGDPCSIHPWDPCENDWGPEGRSQRMEPLRNADVHPLGVTLSNGEFTLTATDLELPGRGQGLTLSRTYRSQTHKTGWLGPNWAVALLDEKVIPDPLCDPHHLRWYLTCRGTLPTTGTSGSRTRLLATISPVFTTVRVSLF